MDSLASKMGSGEINHNAPTHNPPSKLKTYGFAIAIIVGIGGLALGAAGLAGYFHVGALCSMAQVDAIIMMGEGGVSGIVLLIIGIVGCVKSRSKSEEIENPQVEPIQKQKEIPLHKAAENFHDIPGIYSAVEKLINEGADVNAKDEDGRTPLHAAVRIEGNDRTVELLIKKGAALDVKTKSGDTPLHIAAGLSRGKRYFLQTIEILLNNGAAIDARNSKNQTALHMVASDLFAQPIIVEQLLKKGADINARDSQGQTPLHLACDSGNNYLVKYLIDTGADINAQNLEGRTPLHFACNTKHQNHYNMKYLLDHGANINLKNSAGQIPQLPLNFDRGTEIVPPDPFNNFTNTLDH